MSSARVAPVYLPFAGGEFRLRMGLTVLPHQDWLELDENLAAALARKRQLHETRASEVFRVLPEAKAAGRELLDVLATHLCRFHGTFFRFEDGRLRNAVTGDAWEMET